MNELRFVSACLEGEGRSFPTLESIQNPYDQNRKNAEYVFRKALKSCPSELEMEDAVLQLVTAWIDESFERGFVAGMRLAAQALVRE